MDADNVSKHALCCVHKLSQLQLDSLQVEQRAIIRLVQHQFIQNKVTRFRKTHTIAINKPVLLIRSLESSHEKRNNRNKEEEENKAPDDDNEYNCSENEVELDEINGDREGEIEDEIEPDSMERSDSVATVILEVSMLQTEATEKG